MIGDAQLCYIDDCWAYFTTQDLAKQWGDDWNDAPYEHNAGSPYEGEDWQIIKIGLETELITPDKFAGCNGWSVEMINRGDIPWLRSDRWWKQAPVAIMAGTSLQKFISILDATGGTTYLSQLLWGDLECPSPY